MPLEATLPPAALGTPLPAALVARVAELIEAIDAAAEQGDETGALLAELGRETGEAWPLGAVRGYWKAQESDELAVVLLHRRRGVRVADDAAAHAMIEAFDGAFDEVMARGLVDAWVFALAEYTGDRAFGDLIFHPEGPMSPSEVLAAARRRGGG